MGNADGSIIIDTELDSEGFEQGSDKLTKAVQDLANTVDNVGGNMMDAFSKVIPLLRTIANSASQVNSVMGETATQAAAANESFAASEERVSAAANDTAKAFNEQAQGASNFSAGIRSAQSSITGLEREVNTLSSSLQSVSNSAEMGFSNGKAVLTFDNKLQELEQKLAAAREHLEEFGNTQIPTEQYTALTQQIEKAKQALYKLYERRDNMHDMGVDENSAQWQRLTLQISNAEEQLARFEKERDTLSESGKAFISGTETVEYSRMEEALNDAGAVLNRNKALINQEALEQARLNVLTAQEAVAAATTTREREAALKRLEAAQQRLNDVASGMANKQAVPKPSEESVSGWQRFGSVLKSAAAGALRVSTSIAKIGFTGAKKGISGLVEKLKDFVKQGKNSKSMAGSLVKSFTSLKTILMSRIKRMFISQIFNDAKESLNTLAKYSSSFNTAMSNIKNSAKGLSANLAVSLGSLIQVIEPVLTRIINLVSKAVSYFNAFFAMLSGKTTMTVAKKQTDSYASSLDNASKSAKKLNAQLAGFDEINRLEDNSEDSNASVDNPGDLFEEVPIDSLLPDSIKDFFQRIKEAFAAGDWEGIGSIIAEGLNKGIQAVDDWFNNTLRPLGTKWASNIARVLNGLTADLDFGLIGKTISDGLSTIVSIFNTFISTYDFETLGKKISDAIFGFVSNINFEDIGSFLFNTVKAIYDLLIGLIEGMDWSGLAQALWDGLISMIQSIDWLELLHSVIEHLGAAVGGAAAFIGTLAENIWNLLKSAWESVKTYFNDYIEQFGGDIVLGLFNGINDAIYNVAAWIKEHIFQPFIDGFKKAFGINSPSKVMAEQGGFLIAGLLQGITESWGKITSFFSSTLPKLKETISSAWESVKSTASTVWDKIKEKVTGALGKTKTDSEKTANSLATDLSAKWDDVKATTENKWENIKSTITGKWDSLKTTLNNTDWASVGSNICSGIANGINAGWNWLATTVSNLARNLLYSAKRALGIASPSKVFRDEVGEFIGLGIAEGINDTEANVMSAVKNIATEAVDGFEKEKATLQIGVAEDGIAERLRTIHEKLNGIATVLRGIGEYISTIGDIQIPAIAMGEVVPAKTRIASGTYTDPQQEQLNALIGDAARSSETSREMLDVLRRFFEAFNDAQRNGGGTLDLMALARALQPYMKKAGTLTGISLINT